jgi:hypothetical protein
MRALVIVGVSLGVALSACERRGEAPSIDEQSSPPTAAEPITEPITEPHEPEPAEPVVVVAPEPAPPSFDPLTATAATVRIVAVHRDSSWVPCGRAHSTGAVEVEVLEVGEPAPRMILIVSCPVDFGIRQLLKVDEVLDVTLFARRQSWPTPAIDRKLPSELPRRYVKSMIPTTSPGPAPASRSSEAPE